MDGLRRSDIVGYINIYPICGNQFDQGIAVYTSLLVYLRFKKLSTTRYPLISI
jgi:hypothetical protein